MSGVKRQQEDGGGGGCSGGAGGGAGGPPERKKTLFEPCRLGAVSTLEEMDIQVLRFQHQKLKQRLELRQKLENDLRGRIEQLEKRQTQDDLVLNVINRYWNQLNEDIRILLQRFDSETSDESENKNENEATTSFLTQLATWDKVELDEKLQNRVQVSTRAVAKIIQAFDRLQQRNQKISNCLVKTEESSPSSSSGLSLDPVFKQLYVDLESENQSLQALNTALHEKYRGMSLKMMALQEKLTAEETKRDELQNQVDDLNWEVTKLISQNDKFVNESQLLKDKYRRLQEIYGSGPGPGVPQGGAASGGGDGGGGEDKPQDLKVQLSDRELENLERDNEELRELATNRLSELERLHNSHKETLKQLEKLKLELKNLPEAIIVETTEFKCLQSKFSVVYNDNLNLRQVLEENKGKLKLLEETQLRNMENMDRDEEKNQNILKEDMMGIQRRLEEERRKYEMLTVEFEENLKANEQAGPISQEMRHLIGSLQGHNQQLKRDVQKYREKWKEVMEENGRLKRELEGKGVIFEGGGGDEEDKVEEGGSGGGGDKPDSTVMVTGEGIGGQGGHPGKLDSEVIKELKIQLKRAINEQKEMKLLLDMYKGASKDQRDKVQLMAAERKIREECGELREMLRKVRDESRKDERKKLADEEAVKRIKGLEDMVFQLQKQVTAQQQEEEALITEMEVTGTAYEEMQEQNARLLQQLREKDDANFKLMSERIKQSHVQQNALEKVDELKVAVEKKMRLVEAKDMYVRELEGREQGLMAKMTQMEKEGVLRQQAMEMHKRKAIESAQSAQDLKMHLEKYHGQMKDAQQIVAEKTAALEQESWRRKRMQEEMVGLRRRLEHLRKIEMAGGEEKGAGERVLMEEIREYKEMLTCPSCKVKRKDAVLTKCFHVFCMDCLRTRYETRQRKCPKCNAGFGANDYHRLYLS